eukprot:2651124-Prymnesium_polylepis.2
MPQLTTTGPPTRVISIIPTLGTTGKPGGAVPSWQCWPVLQQRVPRYWASVDSTQPARTLVAGAAVPSLPGFAGAFATLIMMMTQSAAHHSLLTPLGEAR